MIYMIKEMNEYFKTITLKYFILLNLIIIQIYKDKLIFWKLYVKYWL